MPWTWRSSAFHASTRGFNSVDLPDPATPIATERRPPVPSCSITARCAFPCADVKSSSGKRSTAAAICAGLRADVRSWPAARAHRLGDRVDIGGRFDAGGDQPLGGGEPGVRPFHGGATLQFLVEDRECRLIGG